MSRDFWHHFWLAFTSRGPYDPTGRDQEIVRLRAKRVTDAEQAQRAIADFLRRLDSHVPEDDTLPVQVGDPHGVPTWRTVDRLTAELYSLATRGGAS